MKTNRIWLGLLASLAITSAAWGQPAGIGGVGTGAPAGNLWSYFCMTPEQKLACKLWFCNSPIGQLISGGSGPVGMATGGLMGGRCERAYVDNAILNAPAGGSENTAAIIKKDEAAAKARRAAVRYLGTVDCNYWPEAAETLRLSLRKDPNECVRWEAAMSLANGCCCTNDIIKALEHCVTGSKADGFPAERSERVRAAAAEALARCPLVETIPEEIKKDIKKVDAGPMDSSDYYKRVAQMPREQVLASARATLASVQTSARAPMATQSADGSPVRRRPGNLADILSNTFADRTELVVPSEAERPGQVRSASVIVSPQPTPAPQVGPKVEFKAPTAASSLNTNPSRPFVPAIEFKAQSPTSSNTSSVQPSTGWITVEPLPTSIGPPVSAGNTTTSPRK